jgi:hypothetical protein
MEKVDNEKRIKYRIKLITSLENRIPRMSIKGFTQVHNLNYYSFTRWLNGYTQGDDDLNNRLYALIDAFETQH